MKAAIPVLGLVIAFSSVVLGQTPAGIIFDTDMGNDVDDALALAMLHAFRDRHEINLLAVTITKDNKWAAPYVDVVNNFYGHPEIPIGTVRNGKTPDSNPMIQIPADRRRTDGALQLPFRPRSRRQVHPSHRGHRSRTLDAGIGASHSRRPLLAADRLGRGAVLSV